MRALAEKALSDKQSNETIILGTIVGEAASDIKKEIGIDVSGFKQTVSANDLRHADNQHGPNNEKRKDQIPLTAEDYERIPELFTELKLLLRRIRQLAIRPAGRKGLNKMSQDIHQVCKPSGDYVLNVISHDTVNYTTTNF